MEAENRFLKDIGAAHKDDAPRLVFADWLEENGDSVRAEFIRLQCQLASQDTGDRQTLRQRERDLLNQHRREWIRQIGLPVDDVRFERGLPASVRLARWNEAEIRSAIQAGRLASVGELDLSGIKLNDAQLREFLKTASLPGVQRLILSDNSLTNVGVMRLAKLANFPLLEQVYLAGNSQDRRARGIIESSESLAGVSVDLGHPEEGYSMTEGQADVARRKFVRERMLPYVSYTFDKYPALESAALLVAQYWDNEANDAVHGELIVSELLEPVLENVERYNEEANDPNIPNTRLETEDGASSVISLWDIDIPWQDNHGAITLWASFVEVTGTQHYEYMHEVYSPAVMFYRHGGYEFLPRRRPHLDGVRPEWEA